MSTAAASPLVDTTALRWRDGLLPTAIGWVWARVCVALGFAVAKVLVHHIDTPRGDTQIHEGLFTWDGTYYRAIAEHWYHGIGEDSARFFPVYPALAKVLGPLFGGHTDWALLFISNVGAFLGALILWRLAVEVCSSPMPRPTPTAPAAAMSSDDTVDTTDLSDTPANPDSWYARFWATGPGSWSPGLDSLRARAVGDRSAWLVAIFPSAFVMCFAYSEGMALVLVAATLLALHRRQFVIAGLIALLVAATRPVGGLLLVPILIELVRFRPRTKVWDWLVGLGGPVAGLVLAMLWIERATGDLFLPIRLQRQLRGGFQDPITRVLEPIGELVKGDFRDTYNLVFMIVLLALALVAVLRRQPLSWLAYMAVSLVLLLSAQVTDSLGRYGLMVVPFIVALAQWTDSRWRQVVVAVACSAGLIWITSEALLGRLVP